MGYVSSDFYGHPVALFVIPVLARHDRTRFDIRCYMTGKYCDPVTLELQRLADGLARYGGYERRGNGRRGSRR